MNNKTLLLCVLLLSACADDQYIARGGQSPDKMSDDLAACKYKIVYEFADNRPGISYIPLVGWIGTISGGMKSDTPDGPMSLYDQDKAITKCMHQKGYTGESK